MTGNEITDLGQRVSSSSTLKPLNEMLTESI